MKIKVIKVEVIAFLFGEKSGIGERENGSRGMMRELDTVSPVVWPSWCYSGKTFFLARA